MGATAPESSFQRLPDDILFLIVGNLDTARDQACLSRTCRKLYGFMQDEGWRAFCRRCFPGVQSHRRARGGHDVRGDGRLPRWDALADTLTWQSRAWDRRAMAFQAMLPRQDHIPRHKRPRAFRSAVAVHFQTDLAEGGKRLGLGVDGEEMLVVGAGEDIVARYRKRGRKGRQDEAGGAASAPGPEWRVLNGQEAGFRPGYDDVCAVSVVENAMGAAHRRGVLAGRENGDVTLVSAEPDETFGRSLAQFVPNDDAGVDQTRVYNIDVSTDRRNAARLRSSASDNGIAAVATPSDILFYPMPRAPQADSSGGAAANVPVVVHPVSAFPMNDAGLYANGTRQPFNARWMEAEGLLAVALGAGPSPLRYLAVTPTGAMELTSAYALPDLMDYYALKDTTLVIPSSLTPVPGSSVTGGNGHLVLSGWRDGTCRLQDLRTASPYDLVYQDNVLGPQNNAQAILVWGTERFVAGNQESAGLKIFDLRWPRRYYHTDALPCSSQMPRPTPPMPMGAPGSMGAAGRPGGDSSSRTAPHFLPPSLRNESNWPPAASEMPLHLQGTMCCNHRKSVRCRWHTASRDLFYRSSSALFFQRSLDDHGIKATGVFSLARASSDLAPANFYAGMNNCVVESFLYEDVVAFESPRHAPSSSGMASIFRTAIWTDGGEAPYFGYPKVPADTSKGGPSSGPAGAGGGHYRTVDVDVAMMETGDSMARPGVETRPMWLPRIRNRKYDFHRVPMDLFDKTTKLGMRDYDRRRPDAEARAEETARIRLWNMSVNHDWAKDKVSFRDRCLHRLDFGLQDDADFS